MAHRNRWTHELTATRSEKVGEDDYNSPIYDDVVVLENEPVTYNAGGTEYVRTETGERVEQTPKVNGRGHLAETLQEGDSITLEPIDPDGVAITSVELRSINPKYGRTSRADTVALELATV